MTDTPILRLASRGDGMTAEYDVEGHGHVYEFVGPFTTTDNGDEAIGSVHQILVSDTFTEVCM